MNLYEKVASTVPGRHAAVIGNVVYNHSCKLPADTCKALNAARDYLEALAFAELEKEIPPWVQEYQRKREKQEDQSNGTK